MAPRVQRARTVVPGRDDVSQQPGNSWKYLYERLNEKEFQQLCAALLVREFGREVTCYPVGHSDGGRDAVRKTSSSKLAIYQVKWTKTRLKDPVSWLRDAVEDERENIVRLIADGATEYILMTNIAGTAVPTRGSKDRLQMALETYSLSLGVTMSCWWQAELDAHVDLLPAETKWTYPEMLAGVEAIRYLMHADLDKAQDRELHTVLRKVIQTQWVEDARVKFKQVELDSHDLTSLFVDVQARRTGVARRARDVTITSSTSQEVGGAARYLLSTAQPFVLVRGEPGQGKSTLGQYICQSHRSAFLSDGQIHGAQRPGIGTREDRMPIRLDLRDYAAWMSGVDPFDEDPTPATSKKPKGRRRPTVQTLETFLAHLLTVRSGGRAVNATLVQDLLDRFPVLLVLDGLDEVANESIRRRVVTEIDDFAARVNHEHVVPHIVVTTRPNAGQLPEPSGDIFETITLNRLDSALRTTYLRKWADAQSVRGAERRQLERTFAARSAEPHVDQLADNPMQLTILLYLMRRLGDSIPIGRTALYTAYMETFLAREAEKSAKVQEHREDLEEVTAFLGWHLQSLAEANGADGRTSAKRIQAAINSYLFDVGKQTSHVAELFTAVTDRVWALTSKIEGSFEFDVQSVREYFAAKFLWDFAGADQHDFDNAAVLRNLIRRPYWNNTTRFYAGFARPNDVAGLVDSLRDEFEQTQRHSQVRLAAWTLLTDRVFRARPRPEREAALLFSDDLSVILLNQIHAAGTLDTLPAEHCAVALSDQLRAAATSGPTHPASQHRIRLSVTVHPDRNAFDQWWQGHMLNAAGSTDEGAWLKLGVPRQAGGRLPASTVTQLQLADAISARAALEAGVSSPADSQQEQRILRFVLDGSCSDTDPAATGLPADLLRVCAPHLFIDRATGNGEIGRVRNLGHATSTEQTQHRSGIFTRLKARDAAFEQLQRALRFNKGQKNTTSPWGDTARTLKQQFGPCWLAGEIAIIGAASSSTIFRTGGTLDAGSQILGPDPDYGRLLQDVRSNRSNTRWWKLVHRDHPDALSRATWALAMLTCAFASVVDDLLPVLVDTVNSLPSDLQYALSESSSRIGTSHLRRPLSTDLLVRAAASSAFAGCLVGHHRLDPAALGDIALETTELAHLDASSWPAVHAASARMLRDPTQQHLNALRGVKYRSSVFVGQQIANVPTSHLTQILKDPAEFPLVWVIASDGELARRADDPPLNKAADQARWFR